MLEDEDIKIAVVCETWLASASNFVTGCLRDHGYSIHHHHRDVQKGGGVSVIYDNTITSDNLNTYSYKSFECVSISFTGLHNRKLLFVALYRCGDEPLSLFFSEFREFSESLFFSQNDLILCGDFNLHCNDSFNSDVIQFYHILSTFNLKQHVPIDVPTHIKGNTIDLVISDPDKLVISDLNVCAESSSDHSIIYFNIVASLNICKPKTVKLRNFKSIDMTTFQTDLKVRLGELCFNDCFKDSVLMFNQIQEDVLNKHAPEITKVIHNGKKPKWLDIEFKEARAIRRKNYKKWRRTRDIDDKVLFVRSRAFVSNLVYVKQRKYYSGLISNCQNSQRELFKVCNNLLDKPTGLSLPQAETPGKLANKFNNYFCDKIIKIRNTLCLSSLKTFHVPYNTRFPVDSTTLGTFELVDETKLFKIITSSKIKTAQDDPIPATLLKESITTLLPYMVQLVNLSLKTGEMDGLKDSIVTPLLKKAGADPEELKNYRPITGIKYLGKLIEKTVLPQLNRHLLFNQLEIPKQSGYKSGHSCETLLVRLVNDIYLNMDAGMCTVVLLLDLSAAFDTIDHDILIDILYNEIGLRDDVLKWFDSFIRGRRQAVSINGTKSVYCDNPFGVAQGSVLGPKLFNIYVRGLIRFLESHGYSVHGYADDHQALKSFRIEFQFSAIKNGIPKCLDLVSSWMEKYFLKLNASKSQVIVFLPDSQSSKLLVQRVFLEDGSTIPLSKDAMNLGALLDQNLSFSSQVDMVVRSCYRLLRDISSIRKFLSDDDVKSLVNSVVISRIDNCNSLYTGISGFNLSKLQRLQNSCARVIYGARRRDHAGGLLKKLHWLPIRQRIIFKVLCLIFKCLHDTAPSYLSEILPEVIENTFVRIPRTKTCYGDHAFSRFGPIYWNALPTTLRDRPSITNFKSKLKHYLFSSSTEYFISLNRYRNWI